MWNKQASWSWITSVNQNCSAAVSPWRGTHWSTVLPVTAVRMVPPLALWGFAK